MAKLKVVFSNEHKFEFGIRFQTKLRATVQDELFGEKEQTYYLWGTKQFEEGQDLEVDLDQYIIASEEVEIDGKTMMLRQIKARK